VRALACYGHRRSLLHRDYVRAKDMFTRALDAAPSAAQTWLKSSYTFAYIGEIEEAVTRAERATELSPRDEESHLFYSALCVAHYTAGNYDTAAQWGMRALAGKTMLRSTAGWAAASLVASGELTRPRRSRCERRRSGRSGGSAMSSRGILTRTRNGAAGMGSICWRPAFRIKAASDQVESLHPVMARLDRAIGINAAERAMAGRAGP